MMGSEKNDKRSKKLSEVVAAQLMDDIKARGWPHGESIGTESELMERYSVSRATIVEATRQVESHGAAEMRRGNGGGLFILGSAEKAASRVISTFLQLSDTAIAELYEAVRILETESVRLAARRADEATCQKMRAEARAISETSDQLEFHARAMRLRFRIAEAGENKALELLLRALARVITSYVRPDLKGGLRDHRFEHLVAADLIAIVESITARDGALADNHTRREAERREARARMLAVNHADLSGGPLLSETPSKLAEKIALDVRNDIARNGWRTGERVANESQLPERYGASQWTMRQAIRALELHGVVEARRGQGGGLFVGTPSPEYAISSAIDFLSEQDHATGAAELRQRMLESVAQLAALRATDAQRQELLELAEGADIDGGILLQRLVAMANNRVLSLFTQILDRFLSQTRQHSGPATALRALARSVSVRDGPMARRHVGDYFDASGPENTWRNSST